MNVTGTWKGEYAFDDTQDSGAAKVAGHTVAFTVKLKQGWLGMVSGTVQDDVRAGFAEAGTVRGRLKDNVLTFRKHMPVLRLMHEPSRQTLEQWADRYKVVVETARTHPPILHVGDVSADGNTVSGRWRMPEIEIEIPGSAQSMQVPALTGSWKLTRQA